MPNPICRPVCRPALVLLALTAVLPGAARAQAPAAPAPAAAAAAAHQDRLLVCNKAAHSLSIFDPATRAELAVLPTGEGPHEVAISPDGRTAVVSDYGAQKPGSTLTVVDIAAAKVLRTIELAVTETPAGGEPRKKTFLRPHGLAFVAADRLVLTSEAARELVLVDLAADRIVQTWPTPQVSMHMVALSKDKKRAFATSIREGNVALFALDGAAAPTIVPTGAGAEGLAVHPTRDEAWVGNRAGNTVSVVDAATGKVVAELPTGDFPFRVAFTPDGSAALVTCAESGDVHVFDAATRQLRRAVSISEDGSEQSPLPMGIAIDPDGRFAYVACGRGEFVAVLDLKELRVVDRIAARAGPDGIGCARFGAGDAAPAGLRR